MKVSDILVDSSRIAADMCVLAIEQQTLSLSELLSVCKTDIYPDSMRAARVIGLYFARHPEYIKTNESFIYDAIFTSKIDGVKRSFLKLIANTFLTDDEERLGFLLDFCMNTINSNTESVAVKASSVSIVYQISKLYPEIKNELKLQLQIQIQNVSTGLKSIYRKIIGILNKEVS